MRWLRHWWLTCALSVTAVYAPLTQAGAPSARQHGTHEHGTGRLNLALDDAELYIELASPAADIVGFEHAPRSDADLSAVRGASAVLGKPELLFRLPAAAGCQSIAVERTMPWADITGHERHGDTSEADREHRGHGHAEHEGHDAHSGHADIGASYHFRCVNPPALEQIEVLVFEAFPHSKRLQVQFVTDREQGVAELTPAQHVLRLRR